MSGSGKSDAALTARQIVALTHAKRHSLAKPIAECRACKRLAKRSSRD